MSPTPKIALEDYAFIAPFMAGLALSLSFSIMMVSPIQLWSHFHECTAPGARRPLGFGDRN